MKLVTIHGLYGDEDQKQPSLLTCSSPIEHFFRGFSFSYLVEPFITRTITLLHQLDEEISMFLACESPRL